MILSKCSILYHDTHLLYRYIVISIFTPTMHTCLISLSVLMARIESALIIRSVIRPKYLRLPCCLGYVIRLKIHNDQAVDTNLQVAVCKHLWPLYSQQKQNYR